MMRSWRDGYAHTEVEECLEFLATLLHCAVVEGDNYDARLSQPIG